MNDAPQSNPGAQQMSTMAPGSGQAMSSAGLEPLFRARLLDPPTNPGDAASIDRFPIIRQIGQGGMGLVFLARHPVSGVEVAIKVISPQLIHDSRSVHRFLTEARHMSHLSHPNILKVLDVSDRSEGPYYVMSYMQHGSLAKLLGPGKPLDEQTILRVARGLAGGLAHAHDKGIIHRDLKPANVLLDENGHACLSDFGLVRTVFNDSILDVRESQCEGTAAYMSPAVAKGAAEDTRCDIYSFGAMLYEMLTGRVPYEGRSSGEVLAKITAGPPERILKLNSRAPIGLVKITEGAMARELRDRYSSMADVLRDIERLHHGKAPVGPHGHEGRRHPVKWFTAASFLIVAVAGWFIATRWHPWRSPGAGATQTLSKEAGAPAPAGEPDSNSTAPFSLPPPVLVTHTDSEGHRVVNLMPLIDVSRDGLTGAWRMTDEGLLSADLPGVAGNLRIPYDPPAEYDFRIEFTRTSGYIVTQITPVKGIGVWWGMGMGWQGSSYIGFKRAGVDLASDAPTHRRYELTDGHRYTSVVQVRKDSIGAIFDGKKIVDFATDFRDMESQLHWLQGSELSLQTNHSTVIFHSIEVVELSGSGKPWPHAIDDRACIRVLKADGPIRRARFTSDGGSLFCIADRDLTIWDLKHVTQFRRAGIGPQYHCVVRADGRYFVPRVSLNWMGYSAGDVSTLGQITADSRGPDCGDFSPDGSLVALVLGDDAISLFDASKAPEFRELKRLQLPNKEPLGEIIVVRFSPDGQRLAVTPRDTEALPNLHLFDIKTGNELWHTEPHQTWIWKLLFNPNGTRIMGTDGDRFATVWDAANGKVAARCEHRTNMSDAAFSADGAFLFTGDSDPAGSLHVWNLSTSNEVERFKITIPVNAIALSKDGHRLLAACDDWTVRLFDADTGKQLQRYVGHDKAVNCVAFSPDEKTFASGSDDRTVRIWKVLEAPQTQAIGSK